MGFGNIGWFQILVVLVIVLLVFGTKKIRNLGGDLGGAIRDFRKGINEDPDAPADEQDGQPSDDAPAAGADQPDAESGKRKDD